MASLIDIKNTLSNIADSIRDLTGSNEPIKGTELIETLEEGIASSLAIPTEFSNSYLNSSLTVVNASDLQGVKEISDFTFYNMDSLTSINIPEGIERIGEYAFAECSNLSAIYFPTSLKIIDKCAFKNCSSLSGDITIKNIEFIYSEAFSGTSIDNIYIYASDLFGINNDALPANLSNIYLKDYLVDYFVSENYSSKIIAINTGGE